MLSLKILFYFRLCKNLFLKNGWVSMKSTFKIFSNEGSSIGSSQPLPLVIRTPCELRVVGNHVELWSIPQNTDTVNTFLHIKQFHMNISISKYSWFCYIESKHPTLSTPSTSKWFTPFLWVCKRGYYLISLQVNKIDIWWEWLKSTRLFFDDELSVWFPYSDHV